jgi:carboxypeptidase PM20D1
MKKVVFYIVYIFLFSVLFLVINTILFDSKQDHDLKVRTARALTQKSIVNLQKAITFKTISYNDSALSDKNDFLKFHQFLIEAYPLLHTTLRREVINNYSLLYTWPGTDTTLKPVLLLAHMDVVPIEKETLNLWSVDPFEGTLKDEFIWGRGAVDDKINLISIMEATENLLKRNYKPKRTIYFAFGHDEEVGGKNGAKKIAELLLSRKIKTEMIMDEGGIITKSKIPNMQKPVALLGTAEKGYLTLTLAVEKSGGHSSMPEKETAIDILIKAITKIRSSPLPAKVTAAQQDFIEYLGPELPFLQRIVFANRWLFESLIINQYSKSAAGNAMMRTTVAPTLMNIGVKENVIPGAAEATINLRLLPGDSIQGTVERLRKTINDNRVVINIVDGAEASLNTDVKTFGYKVIEKATRTTFDSTIVTPFLLIGGTDSKHFNQVSESVIRFSPVIDPIGFHGVNERVSLDGYRLAIWFYFQLIQDF